MEEVITAKHEIKPDTLKSSKIPISACLACSCSTKFKVTAEPDIVARESEKLLVAHDRGETRQQATVEQEKTMLKPELSRLKGAPSTCVCSVCRTQE